MFKETDMKEWGEVYAIIDHEDSLRVRIHLYSFFNLDSKFGGWSTPRPGRFTPGKWSGAHYI
jgi:hypothetical protein